MTAHVIIESVTLNLVQSLNGQLRGELAVVSQWGTGYSLHTGRRRSSAASLQGGGYLLFEFMKLWSFSTSFWASGDRLS